MQDEVWESDVLAAGVWRGLRHTLIYIAPLKINGNEKMTDHTALRARLEAAIVEHEQLAARLVGWVVRARPSDYRVYDEVRGAAHEAGIALDLRDALAALDALQRERDGWKHATDVHLDVAATLEHDCDVIQQELDELQQAYEQEHALRQDAEVDSIHHLQLREAAEAQVAALRKENRIRTRCPSCGNETLFVGSGGHLTCSLLGCQQPSVEHAVADLRERLARLEAALADLRDYSLNQCRVCGNIVDRHGHKRSCCVPKLEAALAAEGAKEEKDGHDL